LAAVQPQDVAEIILELARNTTRLLEMRERGLAAVKRFRWENTTSRLVELALELAGSL
jgi:glycosyltransferase involved in cell wall biosynthesis